MKLTSFYPNYLPSILLSHGHHNCDQNVKVCNQSEYKHNISITKVNMCQTKLRIITRLCKIQCTPPGVKNISQVQIRGYILTKIQIFFNRNAIGIHCTYFSYYVLCILWFTYTFFFSNPIFLQNSKQTFSFCQYDPSKAVYACICIQMLGKTALFYAFSHLVWITCVFYPFWRQIFNFWQHRGVYYPKHSMEVIFSRNWLRRSCIGPRICP